MTQLIEYLAELTGCRDRGAIDATLVNAFRELLSPQSVAIYGTVGDKDDLRWMTRAQQTGGQLSPDADAEWVDIKSLPPLSSRPDRREALSGRAVTSSANGRQLTMYPLVTDHAVVGVLELETRHSIDPQTLDTIRTVLRLYRNFQSLLDYSEHDTLTGLLNRKSFDKSFARIATGSQTASLSKGGERRVHEAGKHCWLGMIDIDHFKSVNDRFGHLIGDEVLLLLARLMTTSLRSDDHLYRFGGEEFVVLLRCGLGSDAASVFERVRATAERHVFPQVRNITVSIGYAQIVENDSPIAALGRADKAIYYAKEHGRNQVQSYAELTASGALKILENVGTVELF